MPWFRRRREKELICLYAEISDLVDVGRPRSMQGAGAVACALRPSRPTAKGNGEPDDESRRRAKGAVEARRPYGGDLHGGARHFGCGGLSAASAGPPASSRSGVETRPPRQPDYPARVSYGPAASPPRPAVFRESARPTGSRRSSGVRFNVKGGTNIPGRSSVKCFECGKKRQGSGSRGGAVPG